MKKPTATIGELHTLVDNTIKILDKSKGDLNKISNDTKIVFNEIEIEYRSLKTKVHNMIIDITNLEDELAKSRQFLTKENHSPADFENANFMRIKLISKRNEEKFVIKRRNELEIKLKQTIKTLDKAENIIDTINLSLDLMTQSLENVSDKIQDLKTSQLIGIEIVKAQEEEKKRVARELHDGPAQVLSNVIIRAEFCDKILKKDFTKAKQEIVTLRTTVSECLEDVKRIVYDLRPISLTQKGLVITVEEYIECFSKESNINVGFICDRTLKVDNHEISLAVFRIVQECLSNIKKHSKATKVYISIFIKNNLLLVQITDNGIGFSQVKNNEIPTKYDHGFGLISMKERIKLLNGKFDINSSQNNGTKFSISIPLDEI